MSGRKVAVVIPCFRVRQHVLDVIARIPDCVERIYAIDDCCPEDSGRYIEAHCKDPRVTVAWTPENQGVGGAVLTGYRLALSDEMDIVVKVDGDGQMDPQLIPAFVRPIIEERADYAKGNRFFSIEMIRPMPPMRVFGNAVLSFINKAVSGYWSIMDPTNGYTAVSTRVLAHLPLDKVERRYFFESDMLYHLGLLRAVVVDVPLHARYGSETSGLSIGNTVLRFPGKYGVRFVKRFFYNYVLRDFNAGSLQTLVGVALTGGGATAGAYWWLTGTIEGIYASSGKVMLAALPIILGFQLLIAAQQWDMQSQPRLPIHPFL